MHIITTCWKCSEENREAGIRDDLPNYRAELQDNGLYLLTCEKGHQAFTRVQLLKFEVLAELAANAIVDGYYRDAIASFTSALDGFRELYIEVVCATRGIGAEPFEEGWKLVRRQSERQLGAYVFSYLLETKKMPPLLAPQEVEFRNRVIHQGRIPTRAEAIEYGQAVINSVAPVLGVLMEDQENYHKALVRQLRDVNETIKGDRIAVRGMNGAALYAYRGSKQQTLAESIERIEKERRWGPRVSDKSTRR